MKTSEVLRRSLKYLWNGKSDPTNKTSYICISVIQANVGREDEIRVQDMIRSRIDPSHTVYHWLMTKHAIPIEDLQNGYRLQTYRRSWVEKMIREFESKGD